MSDGGPSIFRTTRLVPDWIFWVLLYLAIATSASCVWLTWRAASLAREHSDIEARQQYYKKELQDHREALERIEATLGKQGGAREE